MLRHGALLLHFWTCAWSMDWRAAISSGSISGYPSYTEANDILNFFLFQYPHLLTRESIGKSFEDREIFAYRLFRQSTPPIMSVPRLLVTSLLHGREPVTLSLALTTMGTLLEESAANVSDIVYLTSTRELYFVPFMNPDAYALSSADGSFVYRKNRRPTCPDHPENSGIDLNRNFDYHWEKVADPCTLEYAGTAPFSEPETQALRDFSIRLKFVSAMHLHSYGDILTYPFNWNASEKLAPKHQAFYEGLQSVMKFALYGPASKTLGYVTTGESDDWFYGSLGVMSMSPEVGLEGDGFTPNRERVEDIVALNYQRLKYWIYKSGPEVTVRDASSSDETLEVSFVNSGLFDAHEGLALIVQAGRNDCQCGDHHCNAMLDGIRVYSDLGSFTVGKFNQTGSLTFPMCGPVALRGDSPVVCIAEFGLNCRCYQLNPGGATQGTRTIQLPADKSKAFCENAGFTGVAVAPAVSLASVSARSERSGTTSTVIIIIILFLVSFVLINLIRRSISHPAPYIEVVEDARVKSLEENSLDDVSSKIK